MKMKSKVMLLGAMAVVGSGLLFAANVGGVRNSILDQSSSSIVKTASYTESAPVAVDFEKAASAAVPSSFISVRRCM